MIVRAGRRSGLLAAAAVAVVAVVAVVAYQLSSGSSSKPKAVTSSGASGSASPSSTSATTSASGPGVATDHALCASATSGLQAAEIYVGSAEIGGLLLPQSCVYENSVSQAITNSFKGRQFAPQTTDKSATDVKFASVDGSTVVTVHTAKKTNGKWYVVGVTTG